MNNKLSQIEISLNIDLYLNMLTYNSIIKFIKNLQIIASFCQRLHENRKLYRFKGNCQQPLAYFLSLLYYLLLHKTYQTNNSLEGSLTFRYYSKLPFETSRHETLQHFCFIYRSFYSFNWHFVQKYQDAFILWVSVFILAFIFKFYELYHQNFIQYIIQLH